MEASRWLFEAISVARKRTKQNEFSLGNLNEYDRKLEQSSNGIKI
jgi:hypothetical protein